MAAPGGHVDSPVAEGVDIGAQVFVRVLGGVSLRGLVSALGLDGDCQVWDFTPEPGLLGFLGFTTLLCLGVFHKANIL